MFPAPHARRRLAFLRQKIPGTGFAERRDAPIAGRPVGSVIGHRQPGGHMPATKQTKSHSTRKTSATSNARKPSSREGAEHEAIAQLTDDHARVRKMFKQYERLAKDEADETERHELASMICAELTAHAIAEEEIFYPAARAALKESDLIDEAEVEHATAKDLIAQIQDSSPDDPLFDAKVKVLGEYINHHVEEEEGEIFPKVRKAKLDTVSLGEQIAARKAEMMEQVQSEATA
jgi:hemerythrin superfamily protein